VFAGSSVGTLQQQGCFRANADDRGVEMGAGTAIALYGADAPQPGAFVLWTHFDAATVNDTSSDPAKSSAAEAQAGKESPTE
jgi:hypothetical protein